MIRVVELDGKNGSPRGLDAFEFFGFVVVLGVQSRGLAGLDGLLIRNEASQGLGWAAARRRWWWTVAGSRHGARLVLDMIGASGTP